MNPSIDVLFKERFWFSNILKLITGETEYITLFFDPSGITFSFFNASKYALYRFHILGEELLVYDYNATNADGNLEEFFQITVLLDDLYKNADTTRKHAQIRLLYYPSQKGTLTIRTDNNGTPQDSQIKIVLGTNIDEGDKFEADEEGLEPVCYGHPVSLINTFKLAHKVKCKDMIFSFADNKLMVNGIKSDTSSGVGCAIDIKLNKQYLEKYDSYPEIEVKIPVMNTIRYLCNLENISPVGSLFRVFISNKPNSYSNGYIHFRGFVGMIGRYDIKLLVPKD